MSSAVATSDSESVQEDSVTEIDDSKVTAPDRPSDTAIGTTIVSDERTSSPTPNLDEEVEEEEEVVIRTKPELQYSREILITLKDRPLSRIKPSYFEFLPARSILANQYLSKEDIERKRTESLTEDEKNLSAIETSKRRQLKKRTQEKDELGKKHQSAQERLRKEDEIVLSPQRRSFNSGCYVNTNTLQNRSFSTEHRRHRLDSLTSSKDTRDPRIMEILEDHSGDHRRQRLDGLTSGKDSRDPNQIIRDGGTRRLNRGRLMQRDGGWDYRDTESIEHYRPRDERFEKRLFDRRNNEGEKDKYHQDKDSNNKYGFFGMDRRRTLGEDYYKKPEKEPEWFSGGPTSQYDVIELQGFDDLREEKRPSTRNRKHNEKSQINKKNLIEDKSSIDDTSEKSFQKKIQQQSLDDATVVSLSNSARGSKQKEKARSESPNIKSSAGSSKYAEVFSQMEAEESGSKIDEIGLGFNRPTLDILQSPKKSEFSLEEFLKFDSLPGLLSDSGGDADEGGGSKFSRWFKPEAEENSTISDHQGLFQNSSMFSNLINELDSVTGVTDASIDMDKFFTPISPTATNKVKSDKIYPELKHSSRNEKQKEPANQRSLLDILKVGAPSRDCLTPSVQEIEKAGKIHSVEELEAHLRKPKRDPSKDEDMAAFKKLLNQVVGSSYNAPMNSANNRSSYASANKTSSQQAMNTDNKIDPNLLFGGFQQKNYYSANNVMENMEQQMQFPPPDQLKMLYLQQQLREQKQQQQIGKTMSTNSNPGVRLPTSTPQYNTLPPYFTVLPTEIQSVIGNAQLSNELLVRPEAQSLLVGLKRGQITVHHLIEQLKTNFAIQPRYREVLATVIKWYIQQTQLDGDVVPTAQRTSVAPPSQPPPQPYNLITPPNADQLMHQILLSQQQQLQPEAQLGVPTAHNNFLQRIPSPQELIVHTQSIMQSALIKKKLEEQRENFKKRQELQRSQSPSSSDPNMNTSTSPLAFLPTSVLRQNTSVLRQNTKRPPEKELNDNSKLIENQMHPGMVGQSHFQGQQQQGPSNSKAWDMLKTNKGRPIVKKGSDGYSYQPQGLPTNLLPGIEFGNQFNPIPWNRMMNEQGPAQPPPPPPTGVHPSMMGFQNPTPTNRAPSASQAQQHPAIPLNRNASGSSIQNMFYSPNYPNSDPRNSTLQDMSRLPPHLLASSRPESEMFNIQKSQSVDMMRAKSEQSAAAINDQLARWFSPELLAQARAGKLPDMVQSTKMLSVEELERFQQSVPE